MAYGPPLLWHTNPPSYAIWTVFIGGGGWSLICWLSASTSTTVVWAFLMPNGKWTLDQAFRGHFPYSMGTLCLEGFPASGGAKVGRATHCVLAAEQAIWRGRVWRPCVWLRIRFWPPPPTPEFLTKDFPSATRSRMEILTKENLVGAKTAPTAISRTFTPLVRRIRFP